MHSMGGGQEMNKGIWLMIMPVSVMGQTGEYYGLANDAVLLERLMVISE